MCFINLMDCLILIQSSDAFKNACVLSQSVVSNSATLWTVAHQAPLSMEFSRQEY